MILFCARCHGFFSGERMENSDTCISCYWKIEGGDAKDTKAKGGHEGKGLPVTRERDLKTDKTLVGQLAFPV